MEALKPYMWKSYLLGPVARGLKRIQARFFRSADYWERRYARGGNSGSGSYAEFAEFKADVVNDFVRKHRIHTVIEFGCGDGNQLSLADYPNYIGYDISPSAVALCRARFRAVPGRKFQTMDEYQGETADLALSLDVIFHLVEDQVFEQYLTTLFAASQKFVIIYSSNVDKNDSNMAVHVRHRHFTQWIEANIPEWKLIEHIPNRYPYLGGGDNSGSFADFFVYGRTRPFSSLRPKETPRMRSREPNIEERREARLRGEPGVKEARCVAANSVPDTVKPLHRKEAERVHC